MFVIFKISFFLLFFFVVLIFGGGIILNSCGVRGKTIQEQRGSNPPRGYRVKSITTSQASVITSSFIGLPNIKRIDVCPRARNAVKQRPHNHHNSQHNGV